MERRQSLKAGKVNLFQGKFYDRRCARVAALKGQGEYAAGKGGQLKKRVNILEERLPV